MSSTSLLENESILLRFFQLYRLVWTASVAVRGSRTIPAPIETATTPGRRTPGRRILRPQCSMPPSSPAVPILFSLAWLMIVGFRFATSCREGYQFQIPVVEYVWYIQYTVFPLWRERPDGTGRRRPDGAGDDHCPATATSTGCGLSPRITRGSGRIYPYPLHSAFQAGKPDTRHSVARSSALRRVPGSCFSSRIEQRYTFTKRGVPLCAPLSTSYVCGGQPEGPAS